MLFAITDLKELSVFLGRLVSFEFGETTLYYFRNYGIIMAAGCLLSTPILRKWYERQKDRPLGICILFIILLASVAYLTDAAYNPFLYFRF